MLVFLIKMSNSKPSNGTARQMTLFQMSQALAIKNSQTTNGGNNKPKPTSSRSKPNSIVNKKPQIHEIINL